MYVQRQLNLDENKVQDFMEVCRLTGLETHIYSCVFFRPPHFELILLKPLWLGCLLLGKASGILHETTG
jgi:hypothetical protein